MQVEAGLPVLQIRKVLAQNPDWLTAKKKAGLAAEARPIRSCSTEQEAAVARTAATNFRFLRNLAKLAAYSAKRDSDQVKAAKLAVCFEAERMILRIPRPNSSPNLLHLWRCWARLGEEASLLEA